MENDRPASPRRRWALRGTLIVIVGGLLGAGVAGGATGVLSVGEVIPGGQPSPADPIRLPADETVLAKGTAAVAGPWQMTAYESEESAGQPAGLPCLRLVLLDPPSGTPMDSSGFCGEVGDGFGAVSLPVVDHNGEAELLVLGLAPEASETVRLIGAHGEIARAGTYEGPSTFTRGDVFVLTTQQGSDGGELVVVDGDRRPVAKELDASGFFERLRTVQRIAARTASG